MKCLGVVRTQPDTVGRVTARAFHALENERAAPLVFSIKQEKRGHDKMAVQSIFSGLTRIAPAAIMRVAGFMRGEHIMDKNTTEHIRSLNDRFRRTGIGGDILITPGIQELGQDAMQGIAGKVAEFDQFNVDNDPHGEHDFGAFDYERHRIFWKIDYYAPDMISGSENPSGPDVTKRVLTIMLASEY